MNRNLRGLLACLVFGLSTSMAHAVTVTTFNFQGTITSYFTDLPSDPFGGTIAVGDTVTGYYTFDLDETDLEPGTGIGSYLWLGATPLGAHAEINGNSFDYENLLIQVYNNCGSGTPDPTTGCGPISPLDYYEVTGGHSVSSDVIDSVSLQYTDNTATALSNDSLLNAPPSLGDFDQAVGQILYEEIGVFGNTTDYSIGFNLTAVPVPAALPLLLSGIAGLGLISRKRKAA